MALVAPGGREGPPFIDFKASACFVLFGNSFAGHTTGRCRAKATGGNVGLTDGMIIQTRAVRATMCGAVFELQTSGLELYIVAT